MLVYSVLNGVTDPSFLWQIFLLPTAFLSLIILAASLRVKYIGEVKKLGILLIIILVVLDQGMKLWLFSTDWQNMSIPLIDPVFYFEPTHNTLGSYLWVLLKLESASHLMNVVLVLLISTLFVEFWRFYRKKKRNSSWINIFMSLFIAGVSCNLIDNIFHGGSLDYITIQPFYTFDMKDMYISVGLMFMIIEIIDNKLYKDDKEFNREFVRFVRQDAKGIFKRKK